MKSLEITLKKTTLQAFGGLQRQYQGRVAILHIAPNVIPVTAVSACELVTSVGVCIIFTSTTINPKIAT